MRSMAVELIPGVPVRPMRVEEVECLARAGLFDEDRRVELLDGVLVERVSPPSETHDGGIQWLTDWAYDNIDRSCYAIRIQLTMRLPPWNMPLPDLAIVAHEGYRHPTTAALVIEVAESSRAVDLTLKRRIYAQAGVEVYWVVQPSAGVIRVHTHPHSQDFSVVEDVAQVAFEAAVLDVADLPLLD